MFLCYPILLHSNFIEVNIHIMQSYVSTTHASLSDKYICSTFTTHENYLLNNSYTNGTNKLFKTILLTNNLYIYFTLYATPSVPNYKSVLTFLNT
jgi:hypothetical protein